MCDASKKVISEALEACDTKYGTKGIESQRSIRRAMPDIIAWMGNI